MVYFIESADEAIETGVPHSLLVIEKLSFVQLKARVETVYAYESLIEVSAAVCLYVMPLVI